MNLMMLNYVIVGIIKPLLISNELQICGKEQEEQN